MKHGLARRKTSIPLFLTGAVIVALVAVYSFVLYAIGLEGRAAQFWSDGFWTAASLVLSWRCHAAARNVTSKTISTAWRYFAAASLSWAVGILIWDFYEWVDGAPTPFPSLADVGFYGFAALFIMGSFYYRFRPVTNDIKIKHGLNVGIVAVAFVIVAMLVLHDALHRSEETPLFIAIALGYPVLYGTGMVFAMSLLGISVSERWRSSYAFVVGGFAIHAGVNTAYAASLLDHSYQAGLPLDVFWLIGFGLIYLGAVQAEISDAKTQNTGGTPSYMRDEHGFAQPLEAFLSGIVLLGLLVALYFNVGALYDAFINRALFALAAILIGLMASREVWIYSNQIKLQKSLLFNIRQRQKSEHEASRAKTAAELASRAKSEFLANMSHELRTPLNSIIGFSQMMEYEIKGPLPKPYHEYSKLIITSGRLLLETVNSILDLAKIEAGKLELERSDVPVVTTVNEVMNLMRVLAEEKGLALVNDTRDLPTLHVDELRVKQVLMNIVGNAIKFTETGSVTISNRRDESGHHISVSDTGIGMTQEQIIVALEPFRQVHGHSYSRRYQGTGLGLSLCKMIMELHGGALAVASEPHVGTTITASFPATAER